VVSEAYYPGWRVAVDGADAPLWRVNGMMRGVALQTGEHEVVFRFRSRSIFAGAVISGLALVALLAARNRMIIRPA